MIISMEPMVDRGLQVKGTVVKTTNKLQYYIGRTIDGKWDCSLEIKCCIEKTNDYICTHEKSALFT